MKYEVHPSLFLRAPFYGFRDYDLHHLPSVLQRTAFRLAVKLASSGFYKVLENKGFQYDQLSEKEIHTLRKYYNRMSFRATPFGCFATVSALDWMVTEEEVRLADNDDVSVAITQDWASAQHQDPEETAQLFTNPLLYRLGRSWRYIATDPGSTGTCDFSLQELDAVKLNNALLKNVGKGIGPGMLTRWIAGQTSTNMDEASDYIRYLVDEQVLVKDPGRYLIEPVQGLAEQNRRLKVISLEEMAGSSPSGAVYLLPYRPWVSGGPGPATGGKLAEAIQILAVISGSASDTDLAAFIKAFSKRFDRQRVPLLEALDPDAGISYNGNNLMAASITEDIGLNIADPVSVKPTGEWSALHRVLFSLWKPGQDKHVPQPIRLTSALLSGIPANSGALPPTLGVLFRKTAEGLAVEGISGASATQLIGRFSLLNEGALKQAQAMAENEVSNNPDVVFADISHQSEEHVDNINRRKQLYPFELCLNTISALPRDAQIGPDDLLLSVRKGELILESKRLKKRVIPRLATAYNFNRSRLPVFNLLCAMQYQGLKAIRAPQLEQLFPGLIAYPRVYLEDVILSPAKWIFGKDQLHLLQSDPQINIENALVTFRKQWFLPTLISLGQTDQQLVFDLTDPLDSACFLKEIAAKETVIVREYLLSDKTVRAGSDPVAAQYLACLTHTENIYPPLDATLTVSPRAKRSYQPGTEWLYLQIFCTPISADRILSDIVRPVVARMRDTFKAWFFIRYDEDGNHLRLRFKLNPADHPSVLSALNSRLRITGLQPLVQNIRTETYRPELERYPFFLMTKIEKVFEAGSDLILHIGDPDGSGDTLVTGMVTIRMMLEHYGCDLSYMVRLSVAVTDAFIKERGDTKQLRVELNELFRRRRAEINQLFSGERQSLVPLDPWCRLAESIASLARVTAGLSGAGKERLIADLIHMQLNRTFSAGQRIQEMAAWYCLYKYWKGLQARSAVRPPHDRDEESNKGLILRKNASR